MLLKNPVCPTLIPFFCLLPKVTATVNLVVFIPMPFSLLLLNIYISTNIRNFVLHVFKPHNMVLCYKLCFCNLLCSWSVLGIHPCWWYMYFWFMYFNCCIVFHCRNIAQYNYPFSSDGHVAFPIFCFYHVALDIFVHVFWCNNFSRRVFFSFLKQVNFEMILDLQKRCKNSTEFPYNLHPASPDINIT